MEFGIGERFLRRVPNDVLIELVTSIRQGTRDAGEWLCQAVNTGRYSRPNARDVFPYERRAHVETRLERLPQNFARLSVESRLNRVRNCHQLIRMPGVLMTVSSVPNPNLMVRASKARKAYASGAAGNVDFRQSFFSIDDSNQLVFGRYDDVLVEEGLIYGVVYYSPAEDNHLSVGYVGVGFPDMRYRRYVETLDLTRLFPEAACSTEVERIEDHARVDILLGEPEEVDVSKLFNDGGV